MTPTEAQAKAILKVIYEQLDFTGDRCSQDRVVPLQHITAALTDAYERGRREQREVDARIVESKANICVCGRRLSRAIRAQAGKEERR